MDGEPDQRAGAASKPARAFTGQGCKSSAIRLPTFASSNRQDTALRRLKCGCDSRREHHLSHRRVRRVATEEVLHFHVDFTPVRTGRRPFFPTSCERASERHALQKR